MSSDEGATAAANDGDGNRDLAQNDLLAVMEEMAENPLAYNAHLKYVSLLKALGQLEELRQARESMHSIFPLSEGNLDPSFQFVITRVGVELWLEWIEDEKMAATTDEQKHAILELYARATKDYFSVNLWKEYMEYAVSGAFPEEESDEEEAEGKLNGGRTKPWLSITEAREVCAVGSKATELHLMQSHQTWNVWRDFEMQVLETHESPEQIERIRKMYNTRLKVPHSTLAQTYSDYSPFVTQVDNMRYEEEMKAAGTIRSKTEAEFNKYDKYETLLTKTNNDLATFLEYIAFERKRKGYSKLLVRTLFERAATIHCLDPSLWEHYLVFMVTEFSGSPFILEVASRATRNCSWSGDLWGLRLRLSFGGAYELDALAATYNAGCAFVSQLRNSDQLVALVKAFCFILRGLYTQAKKMNHYSERRTKKVLTSLQRIFNSSVHLECGGDAQLRLERLQIDDEVHLFKNLQNAHTLYDELLKKHASDSSLYVEAADFELNVANDVERARAILKQGCNRTVDWPQRVFDKWLDFESRHGTLEDYFRARGKIKVQEGFNAKRWQKTAAHGANGVDSTTESAPEKRPRNQDNAEDGDGGQQRKRQKKNREEPKGEDDSSSMQVDEQAKPQFVTIDNPSAGNMVQVSELVPEADAASLNRAFGALMKKLVDYYVETNEDGSKLGYVEFSSAEEAQDVVKRKNITVAKHPVVVKRCIPSREWNNFDEANDEGRKIYVTNLDIAVDKPVLRSVFGKSAERSLSLDAKPLEGFPGRKISVAIADPKMKKFGNYLVLEKVADPKELFVSNFPRASTKEEVTTLFEQHGLVKAVRLLYQADGVPRGAGFVEFDTEESASAALSLNGFNWKGRFLVVTRSDPNVRSKGKSKKGDEGRTSDQRNPRGTNTTRAEPVNGPEPAAENATSSAISMRPRATMPSARKQPPRRIQPVVASSLVGEASASATLATPTSSSSSSSSATSSSAGLASAAQSDGRVGKSQDEFRAMLVKK
ncbi:hypothetical protein DFJ73DRAFT_918708 [Zopfochytrium polystomum]|nr:hypothetical protein DFJ73DRAFT_918708 [Zopfochytrium polystomum]